MFKGANRTILIMILATLLVIAGIVAGFLMHAKSYVKEQMAKYEDYILTNVYIENINVGEMTRGDAKVLLSNYIENNADNKDLELIAGDRKKKVKFSSFGIDYNVEEAVEKAYDVGRSGTLFSRYFLFHKMQDELKKTTIKLEKTVDEEKITSVLNKNSKDLNHDPVNASLKAVNKDGKLTGEIVKEAKGQAVEVDKSADKINEYLNDKWKMDSDKINLDVTTTDPAILSSDLEDMTDVLGTYTTKGKGERSLKNVKKAAGKINGSIIDPGSTLSLYEKTGPFTKENGYISAYSTTGSTEKMIMGGGVGQASTAVYLAALVSDVPVEERHSYGILTDYAKPAFDAALSDAETDLKLSNDGDTGIYLKITVDNKNINVTFFGKNDNNDRVIKLESKVTRNIPAKVEKIKDKKLLKGKKEVVAPGRDGCDAEAWKAVYVNGELTSHTKVNTSHYDAVKRVEKIGTKKKKKKKKKIDNQIPIPNP